MRRTLFIVFVSLLGCNQLDDQVPAGTQLLRNPDISSPNSPQPWVSVTSPGFTLGVSNQIFRSGSGSLFIENADSTNLEASTWRQTINSPLPKEGRKLTLRAYLKGEEIKRFAPGSNVFVSFRAFPVQDSKGNTAGRFITSQERIIVDSTFTWRPIELVLNKMPPEVDYLIVYLAMAPRTTGKVYFDDITLTVD
jgi:hypothetical protein